MMDRQKGNRIVFECDGCDNTLETDETDFDAARVKFQEAGWRSARGQGRNAQWEHYCPTCRDLL